MNVVASPIAVQFTEYMNLPVFDWNIHKNSVGDYRCEEQASFSTEKVSLIRVFNRYGKYIIHVEEVNVV